MIFHCTLPPRLQVGREGFEVKHKVVVDDEDMNLMSPQEIMSYFPPIPKGFRRVSIIQGHDSKYAQTAFLVVDHEIGVQDGSRRIEFTIVTGK